MTMSDQNMENEGVIDLAEREAASRLVAYTLGQLDSRQCEEFERRMADDPELAQQVEEERAFAASLRTAVPAGMPRAEAFAALDLTDAPAPEQRTLRYGLAAAVAVLGVGLLLSMPAPDPGFETLSSDSPAVVSQGVTYRVVLNSENFAGAPGWLVEDYQLSVVSGADGVLVLRRDTPLSGDQLQALRSHPAIALLEQQAE